jgi:hypothetical protein
MRKAPRKAGLFSYRFHLRVIYRPAPEPGPVGANVDPLGEPLGASVLPDGFMVVFGPLIRPGVVDPVALPVVPPVVFPFMDEPLLAAEPPVVEPPPAVPPLLCASANVLVSTSAPANAIVVILMVVSFVRGGDKPKEPAYVPPPPPQLSARRDAPKPAAGQYGHAHAGQLRRHKSHDA